MPAILHGQANAAYRAGVKSNVFLAWSLVAMMLSGAGRLGAQLVRGIVTLPDSSRAAGVIVMATGDRGLPAVRVLTGERGEYELHLPGAGRYAVRVLRVGFRPTLVPAFDVAAADLRTLPIVLRGEAIVLSAVTVRGKSVCRMQQDSGQEVARLWEEARKAITATQLSRPAARQMVRWTVFDRSTDLSGRHVLAQSSSKASALAMKAFVSLPPDSLARVGYVSEDATGTLYRAPDADVLLSDAFASQHCFHVQPPVRDRGDWIGIGFLPASDHYGITDIEGTLWLDRLSSELRLLEFRYANLPVDYAHYESGGSVEFLRLSTGSWLVGRWEIRMPRGARRLVPSFSTGAGERDEFRTVIDGLQFTGGEVTAVQRGQAVLFSSGESARDYSPALIAEDQKMAAACSAGSTGGDLRAFLRGTVFEGEHKPVAGAAVRLTWQGEFRAPGTRSYSYRSEQRDLTSNASGDWGLCGIPRERIITVRAAIGSRSSVLVTVRIPRERAAAGVDVEVPPP